MFLSDEKYKLELRWEDIVYTDNTCKFTNAYFTGPVLQIAEKIEPDNKILLDFFKQYFVLVENVYIGELSWGDVTYKDNKVFLSDCIITHDTELHKVPKLDRRDFLIIDCKMHERETHDFYPNYKTHVVNEDNQLYTFVN